MYMPVTISGKKFYRTQEAIAIIGISRSTFFRWIRAKKIKDTKHKDFHGWRLFTAEEIKRITNYTQNIKISE